MRWRPGSRSEDLVDERSSGGRSGGLSLPGGRGGGIAGLIVVVIAALLGGGSILDGGEGDSGGGGSGGLPGLDDLLRGLPDQPGAAAGGRPLPGAPDPEAKAVGFVSFVLDDVQNFWAGEFRRAGREYPRAKLVLFRRGTNSGCGAASSETGPFYCPLDQRAYLDLGFFAELQRRFGAPGDFAQAYVLAHEIGHHVQNVLGIEQRVREAQASEPDRRNEFSVLLELQADCFAGSWARSTYSRKLLEEGDVDEAIGAAAAVGDDRIQEAATGRANPETFTHGSAEQRKEWFTRGYRSGDSEQCDTFAAAGQPR